jgi:hypothetical protein
MTGRIRAEAGLRSAGSRDSIALDTPTLRYCIDSDRKGVIMTRTGLWPVDAARVLHRDLCAGRSLCR